jgi:hypothetical protein
MGENAALWGKFTIALASSKEKSSTDHQIISLHEALIVLKVPYLYLVLLQNMKEYHTVGLTAPQTFTHSTHFIS